MFKQSFYILSIVILFSLVTLSSGAKDTSSEFLPKTKDMANGSKDSMDTKDVDDKSGLGDNQEEEVDNPEDSFKLIAIYLVGNKPRALIKNIDKPEDPSKEFQVGDYVDELGNFAISKILLNPTARVELIDPNGLNYIIKPKNTEDTNSTQLSKTSKSPTYSSGNKVKIKRAVTSSTKPAVDTSSSGTPAVTNGSQTEKKEETTSLESAIKNDAASQTATPPPSSTTSPPPPPSSTPPPTEQPQNPPQQESASSQAIQTTSGGTPQAQPTTTTTSSPAASMTGSGGSDATDTRPKNPFGE